MFRSFLILEKAFSSEKESKILKSSLGSVSGFKGRRQIHMKVNGVEDSFQGVQFPKVGGILSTKVPPPGV